MKMNGGWSWILDFFYACMRMKILCVFKWRMGLCLEDKMLCYVVVGSCVSKVVMAMMNGGVL